MYLTIFVISTTWTSFVIIWFVLIIAYFIMYFFSVCFRNHFYCLLVMYICVVSLQMLNDYKVSKESS